MQSHLAGDKWSYQIRLNADNRIFGMKKFSIQRLKERHYIYDWFYKQILLLEKQISMRSKFVNIFINGNSYGVYQLEEHFDHILVENNQQKDAPIFKFYELHYWNIIFIN